jgi:hypothetical protein
MEIYISKLELQKWFHKFVISFINIHLEFGIQVWYSFGIFSIYFPNYEKLKSVVETFIPNKKETHR